MMAVLEVLSGGALVIGILALVWNLANAFEAWRYLRRRPSSRGVVIRFSRRG